MSDLLIPSSSFDLALRDEGEGKILTGEYVLYRGKFYQVVYVDSVSIIIRTNDPLIGWSSRDSITYGNILPADGLYWSVLRTEIKTKDELVAHAASKYPIGSYYITHNLGDGLYTKNCVQAVYAPRWINNDLEVGWGYVFYDGKWAEAVESCDGERNIVRNSAMNELQEQLIPKSGWDLNLELPDYIPQISKTKPPDNPYIQQPLIIKKSHKRKTLTII